VTGVAAMILASVVSVVVTAQPAAAEGTLFMTDAGPVRDSGFENQTTTTISAPWVGEGPDFKGIDRGTGLANSGANNAFIRTSTRNWNAVTQHVAVQPYTTYRLQAWLRTSSQFPTGYLGVRGGTSTTVVAQTPFGVTGGYRLVSVEFLSYWRTDVTVFVGYQAPGVDSWVQIDDVYLGAVYSNWAGYSVVTSVHTPNPISSVQASWIEPNFPCLNSTDKVSMWVGIDGLPGRVTEDDVTPPRLPKPVKFTDTLIQIGTEATCASGHLQHFAWCELINPRSFGDHTNGEAAIGGAVWPGDRMQAWVLSGAAAQLNYPDHYALVLSNATRNWTATIRDVYVPYSPNQSGEVIAEAPSNVPSTWPDFGSVQFDSAAVNNQAIGSYAPMMSTSDNYPNGFIYEPSPVNWGQSSFTINGYRPNVLDHGFEMQPALGDIAAPWSGEGPDFKGIDRNHGLAHSGANNAFIRTSSWNWNAITQRVLLPTGSRYRLHVWLRANNIPGTGSIGVRVDGLIFPIASAVFSSTVGYQEVTVLFDPGSNSSLTIFIGYTAQGSDSWVQIDDVTITPV
jgi:hypothetical protein